MVESLCGGEVVVGELAIFLGGMVVLTELVAVWFDQETK